MKLIEKPEEDVARGRRVRFRDVPLPELGEDLGMRLWGPSAGMCYALVQRAQAMDAARKKAEDGGTAQLAEDPRWPVIAACAGDAAGRLYWAKLDANGELELDEGGRKLVADLDNELVVRLYEAAAELVYKAEVEKAKGES